jgi:hypothetical protein
MTTTLTRLICPECRHENEAERIYCHSCGARLDRSAVASRKEPVKDTRQRVKKMFDPQRAKIRQLFFKVSKLVLGSCAIAALIQIVSPPDVAPPPKGEMLASQIRFDLEGMTTGRHQPPQVQYSEEQVNSFLLYALKTKQASLDKPLLDFKRVVVGFSEGTCAVTEERALFGYSFYLTCAYAPTLKEGKLQAPSRGGTIGRLPVHPQLAQVMGLLFTDVWSVLDREIKMVRKLGRIEFHDKQVVLTATPQ